MEPIAFTVLGKPQPKGAHTSFVPTRKDGSLVMKGTRPVVVTKDTNPRQEAAQGSVMSAAIAAREEGGHAIWLGPAAVTIRYFFDRNKGDFGTGRNARRLKESAPLYPVSKADIDKLERLVFDGLTGTLLRDDKQVVRCVHEKLFAEGEEPARLEVELERIEQQTVTVPAEPDAESVDQLALVA